MNRLGRETSPYLLQHAHNPVDWYPWGDEALQRARAEDKPILVSIGYSACHWCHVMERESFEDACDGSDHEPSILSILRSTVKKGLILIIYIWMPSRRCRVVADGH